MKYRSKMMKKQDYNPKLNLKPKLKTQKNIHNKLVRNFKINNGVIFIDGNNNPRGNFSNSQYERKEERTYWFHKYLQDLQNRGISKKIVRQY